MSESLYRLTFSGELLEGQHAAVVKKKLGTLLKLEPERVEKLFSGATVVIKKSVDEATAARFQAVFKQAGGRLLVALIVVAESDSENAANEVRSDFDLAEAGSNLLEKSNILPDVNIDTSHLDVASIGNDILEEQYKRAPIAEGPDVSHISLSDNEVFPPTQRAVLDALVVEEQNWELGAVGDDMLEEYADIVADIDLDAIDFELAETGSLMNQDSGETPPPPPDTSHITLTD